MSMNDRESTLVIQRDAALFEARKWKGIAEARQAKIDALMLEYCPEEMTAKQLEEWGNNQTSLHDGDSRHE